MANLKQLHELAERLENAPGPDRDLDRMLTELVYIWDERYLVEQGGDWSGWKPRKIGVWVDPDTDIWTTTARDGMDYTASIEDALALVERLMPGKPWIVGSYGAASVYCTIGENDIEKQVGMFAASPALALLRALVAALIAQGEDLS